MRNRPTPLASLLIALAALSVPQVLNAQEGETITREAVQPFVPVTDAMLRDPDPEDWLMAHRTYDFQGFRRGRYVSYCT